ncbi:MurR/RpiR family transcriptional regulator [Diplocloster modestus]|uniref:MurR/RpiR family transcriptional regulator n=1 Tax=Diplocloster modestus TaxID=2850322 RepID=A0ABS6K421_9FIRM|nr:MurR/RpiR family transcriptional regulator [Diplocloster modestus]MBU9725279.1 MurR/RpiR family transcriptional regulator [Diplocloster modestus]
MSGFMNKISENFDMFTHSQKAVANYLMDNLDHVAFCTLEDIAARIGVSTTTVIRFSRVLGYAGFSEMQKDIQSNIKSKVALPERLDNMMVLSDNQLLNESFANDIQNIQKTMAAQNDEDLQKVIRHISDARNVYILGMRSSFSIAHYLASRLGEIKKNVRLVQSIGMIYPEEIVGAEKGDICIAYLFPRYSKIAATIISWLKNMGVEVILVTSLNYSAVSGYGDIILPCAISSISYKNSFAAPLCLTNYLIAALAKNNYEESRETLARTESILSQGYYLGL